MTPWRGYAGTANHRRLIAESLAVIRKWRAVTTTPIVSVSGGKDSVLLLSLCREVDPSIPAIRADPPNPYPDREEHVDNVVTWFGGRWHIEAYPWDVAAVLAGAESYPHNLKVRRLNAAQMAIGVDGVAMGIRAAESRQRAMTARVHGPLLRRADGVWSCRPLLAWSALDVLAEIERRDLPLNPIYHRLDGLGHRDYDHIRDGTWWPHGEGAYQQIPWMRRHYPDVAPMFELALTRRTVSPSLW